MIVVGEGFDEIPKLSFMEARLEISQLLDRAMFIALRHPECNEHLAKSEVMFSGNSMREDGLVVTTIMASDGVLQRMWDADKEANFVGK